MSDPVQEFLNTRKLRRADENLVKVAALLKDVVSKAQPVADSANHAIYIKGLDEFRNYMNDIQRNWDMSIKVQDYGILMHVFNIIDRIDAQATLQMVINDINKYLKGDNYGKG